MRRVVMEIQGYRWDGEILILTKKTKRPQGKEFRISSPYAKNIPGTEVVYGDRYLDDFKDDDDETIREIFGYVEPERGDT